MTRTKIVDEAKSWLRTPYHHQAAIKHIGVDCAMLLIAVYHACGLIPDIDPRPYSPDWMLHREEEKFIGWVEEYGYEVESPKAGDVLVWRFGRCFSHGGILTDEDGSMIHAYQKASAVVVGNYHDSELIIRPMKAYCLRGVE
jgi:NlpC/P60 family putative phage cell wall peptidase